MARAYVKSPIPHPPNPLGRLFSEPSNLFTNYLSHPDLFVPTLEVSDPWKGVVRRRKELWVESIRGPFFRPVTIGRLPDDILLEIFDFYVDSYPLSQLFDEHRYDWWHVLVHVCRRWRNVVFESPRRLDLKLLCNANRSVKEMLDIWPELPIMIVDLYRPETVENVKNVINALELNDRVSVIILPVSCSDMEIFAPVIQDPFPALTYLELWSNDGMAPVISYSFLGGSAPRLRELSLRGILFPALPNLLLSATDLVHLNLWNIPHSGYISPEAMVASLSALSRLKSLSLEFRSPRSRPAKASGRRPLLTPTILPTLTYLKFRGVTEYLEELVARIDAPLLVDFSITFFNQLVFGLLQLIKFLCRTEMFTELNEADVVFDTHFPRVDFSSRTEISLLSLAISCRELDWQLSSLSQVCNSILLGLSAMDMECLELRLSMSSADPPLIVDDMENTQWLELLHPFTNVKDLRLFREVPTFIAQALEELAGERVTEILPTLQTIFLDGFYRKPEPAPKAISEFVAARQLSGCPVALHRRSWDSETRTWVVIESSTQ